MIDLLHGDCLALMPTLPAESVQCVVTSPPYFGLRDYGVAGQIGLEPSPQAYVDRLVAVFREVRRVLRTDGTCWLNLGDSYAASTKGSGGKGSCGLRNDGRDEASRLHSAAGTLAQREMTSRRASIPTGLKPKDLMMIPARVALALQADGWWLRSEIIWSKSAPMPESVRDRPTCAHEKVFLLTRSERYFYDADAVADDAVYSGPPKPGRQATLTSTGGKSSMALGQARETRNLRNVWHLNPEPSGISHYAMMPTKLAATCIKAGSRPGDTVLDPFAGVATTLLVADRLQRHAIGIELNAESIGHAKIRLASDAPLLSEVA